MAAILKSLGGQGCVCLARPVRRLLQVSDCGDCGRASAAVACFWLQFHTSWQKLCVKRTDDSGCEIHRGRGLAGPGSTKEAHAFRDLCLWPLCTSKRKEFINE